MDSFLQYFFHGLSNGAIYASLSLAIVIIVQTIRQPNFAQGEMATFSTFVALYLIQMGVPYWGAVGLTVVFSFFWGAFIHRVFYHPVENSYPTSQLIVIIGLFLAINGLAGWIFGYDIKAFPYPFSSEIALIANKYMTTNEMFVLFVLACLIAFLTVFYRYTKVGLALRALAQNPTSSALMGVNVNIMLMLNWGVAAVMGGISGMMVAPIVFLDKNLMAGIFIYSVAGCIVGGMYSPVGAVLGAFFIAMVNAILIDYLGYVPSEIKLAVTFIIIVLVLLYKPEGLLAKKTVKRM